MNCNEFLESVLEEVSGDRESESHLAECSRCRSMLEVLSPLRAAGAAQMARLPRVDIKSTPQPQSVQLAADLAFRFSESVKPQSGQVQKTASHQRDRTWRYAMAFLAGAAASLAGVSVVNSNAVTQGTLKTSTCLWESKIDARLSEESLVRACVACHLVASN